MNDRTIFIVIDDDQFNNMLCGHIIKHTVKDADVFSFSRPEEGLDFIQSVGTKKETSVIVLVDINMPSLTGWDVLERIEAMAQSIKNHLRIYMFSSSVDKRDKERACLNPLVLDYIEKPLDPKKVLRTLESGIRVAK